MAMALSSKILRNLHYAAQEASLRIPVTHEAPTADNVLISLTSYPARIGTLWKTLETIYRQSVLPAYVLLVLSADEFPRRDLPDSVKKYERLGMQVIYVDGNNRSYKKLIPALAENPDMAIVTADDDVLYPRHWFRDLVAGHKSEPERILGFRGTVIQPNGHDIAPYVSWPQATTRTPSSRIFLTGMGGILYPPRSLPSMETTDMALAMQLAPTADDIWFKAMSLLAGTTTSKVSDSSGDFATVRSAQKWSLRDTNVAEGQNEVQFRAVMNHFGLWHHLSYTTGS